ncbi:MAG: hypothetical protein KF802_02600 [Bdellovibrionaceae bacterium]|nr:hypothetical protein [Pseudobdellovibrionaceae bacterium]
MKTKPYELVLLEEIRDKLLTNYGLRLHYEDETVVKIISPRTKKLATIRVKDYGSFSFTPSQPISEGSWHYWTQQKRNFKYQERLIKAVVTYLE